MTRKIAILFSAFLMILSSCKKDDPDNPVVNNEYLLNSTLITSVGVSEIKAYVEVLFGSGIDYNGEYDVDVYSIDYKTISLDGDTIVASGAIILPQSNITLPILSYQHGTLHNQKDAPSNFDTGHEVKYVATAFACSGYAVIMPDYIGYGSSADYPHKYEHGNSLSSASLDMIKAAKEFFVQNTVSTTDKLFLTGYSEGGYATMALHKWIEETTDWEVTMSAPAAGAYNKTAFCLDIIERNEELDFLPSYMWVLYTYNWVYDMNRSWSQMVNTPDDEILEMVSNPMNFNIAPINKNPAILLKSEFVAGIKDGTDHIFLNALADNGRFNWSPKYPITLYYGTEDDFVFPLNSVTAYNSILANGGDINIVSFAGKDHQTAVPLYLESVYQLFESMK